MRDKTLSEREEKIRVSLDSPDIPNNHSGETIMMYKMYCSVLEQVVRLDAEMVALDNRLKTQEEKI